MKKVFFKYIIFFSFNITLESYFGVLVKQNEINDNIQNKIMENTRKQLLNQFLNNSNIITNSNQLNNYSLFNSNTINPNQIANNKSLNNSFKSQEQKIAKMNNEVSKKF